MVVLTNPLCADVIYRSPLRGKVWMVTPGKHQVAVAAEGRPKQEGHFRKLQLF